ncbi:MAG TPA: DNA-processing protein DprA [Actinomycetota bacterium]
MPPERASPAPDEEVEARPGRAGAGDARSLPRGWPEGFAASEGDREALLRLSTMNVVPAELYARTWKEGSAAACLAATREPRSRGPRPTPGEILARLEACGGRFLGVGDPGFPERLLDLPDPPAWLFVRGSVPLDVLAVAIIGARRCSSYGRETAEAIGRGLAALGVAVVSGAALGIDGAGHRGALEGEGHTIAVLGSGVDVPYPPSNRDLIERIAVEGALISEYPPGTPANGFRFPARNRLIAALARSVVVVEGAAGSGSMITAEIATDVGREVYAVPGNVTSRLAEVPNALIRDGAPMVRHAQDVLDCLRGEASHAFRALRDGDGGPPPDEEGLNAEERRVLGALAAPATAEGVAGDAGLPLHRVLPVLAALELRGLVRDVGGRFERRSGEA